MNDFTKEELEEIIMWAAYLVGCNPCLLNKIQSMIDNYCDHLWSDGSGNLIFCVKCHVNIGKRQTGRTGTHC